MNIFKNPKIALKHTEITLKLHLVRNHIFIVCIKFLFLLSKEC